VTRRIHGPIRHQRWVGNFTLNNLKVLERIAQRGLIRLEILLILGLEVLLELLDLVLELVILQAGQPLAIVAGHIILKLTDPIILADRGHDLRDRLPHTLFIGLGRLGHTLWERSGLAAARGGRVQPAAGGAAAQPARAATAASTSARVGRLLLVIFSKY